MVNNRVPTQIAFSNSLCFPCFSRLTSNFPCANLRDLLLLHTKKMTWQTYQASNKFGEFRSKFKNIFQGIYNLSKQNSLCFPCVLAKFPNSLFSLTGIFLAIFLYHINPHICHVIYINAYIAIFLGSNTSKNYAKTMVNFSHPPCHDPYQWYLWGCCHHTKWRR